MSPQKRKKSQRPPDVPKKHNHRIGHLFGEVLDQSAQKPKENRRQGDEERPAFAFYHFIRPMRSSAT